MATYTPKETNFTPSADLIKVLYGSYVLTVPHNTGYITEQTSTGGSSSQHRVYHKADFDRKEFLATQGISQSRLRQEGVPRNTGYITEQTSTGGTVYDAFDGVENSVQNSEHIA